MSTTIVKRAEKGSTLTTAEMDQNLENLKTTADGAQSRVGALEALDIALRQCLPTEAEFMALAAGNRDRYAGSGFVEWGKQYNSSSFPNVNNGMWTWPAVANRLMIGDTTLPTGVSKTNHAVANVNGVLVSLAGVADTSNRAMLALPQAPEDASLPERQDLIFLEVWHEKVSDKDFVYPYGNCQSNLSSDITTGLTCANGGFTGYATYSLFGNWQSASALIGKGLVWSTMSAANKATFVSNPGNNCYLANDGGIVQVRYRVRVIEGLGASWDNVNNTVTSAKNFQYANNQNVCPKGIKVSITDDVAIIPRYVSSTTAGQDKGAFAVYSGDTPANFGYNGLCYAIPVALVSRRNQGAFHPVWNPSGSARSYKSDDTASNGYLWYSADAKQPGSVNDCFTVGGSGTGVLVESSKTGNGSVAGNLSGRPDSKFYDVIYEPDILDLRNSAHKPLDLNRLLDREFNNLVSGVTRGWEAQAKADILTQVNGASGVTSIYVSDTSRYRIGMPVSCYDATLGSWVFQNRSISSVNSGTVISVSGSSFTRVGGNTYIVCVGRMSPPAAMARKTILQCDIIGDPAIYPAGWTANGVMGTPLVFDDDGNSLIPDNTTQTWKMTRRVKSLKLTLYSTDSGATWITTTAWDSSITGATNGFSSTQPTNALIMVFYEAEASPLASSYNAEVLSFGDAKLICNYAGQPTLGSFLTGKVTVGAASNGIRSTLTSYGLSASAKMFSTESGSTGHNAFVVVDFNTNPAAKALPYLTRENGRLYLQLIFKEMHYNGSSWGDDGKFNVVNNVATATDNNGATVIVGQKRLALPYFIGDGE